MVTAHQLIFKEITLYLDGVGSENMETQLLKGDLMLCSANVLRLLNALLPISDGGPPLRRRLH